MSRPCQVLYTGEALSVQTQHKYCGVVGWPHRSSLRQGAPVKGVAGVEGDTVEAGRWLALPVRPARKEQQERSGLQRCGLV
eukprot:1160518-Pelagomonas_calceolata.AAC.5